MVEISKEAILRKTHYGLNIYAHILQCYYPEQLVLSISGRTCLPARNPFNNDKPTLCVEIENNLAKHRDSEDAIPDGDVFNFAELHFKQSGVPLLQTINNEMFLNIGEEHFILTHQSPKDSDSSNVILFSFYKAPIKNTKPYKSVSLSDIYKYIVGDYCKQRTEELRTFNNPKLARQYKAQNFDYCTFSGIFTSRNDKALIHHSGLMAIDFDHLQNLETLRKALLADEYFDTQLLFISPSGDGLKWIIPIDTTKAKHGEYFAAVANYILKNYGVEVDKSGRDLSRACFLPNDPNVFINPLIVK